MKNKFSNLAIILLQAILIALGAYIWDDVKWVKKQMSMGIKSGAWDLVIDYFADKDSLTVEEQKIFQEMLLKSSQGGSE